RGGGHGISRSWRSAARKPSRSPCASSQSLRPCFIAGLPSASRSRRREGGGGSPATPAAAARSSTRRLTRAPMRGASTPRILNVSSRMALRLFPRRQLLRGDLGLDALRLGGVEVQLDLDAVGVVHEEL